MSSTRSFLLVFKNLSLTIRPGREATRGPPPLPEIFYRQGFLSFLRTLRARILKFFLHDTVSARERDLLVPVRARKKMKENRQRKGGKGGRHAATTQGF